MNVRQIFIAAATIIITALTCNAQTTQLLASKANDYGLSYSLPTTGFKIQFLVRKTVCKPGPYCQYAKKYLSTDNAITEESRNISFEKIAVTPYGIPTDSLRYVVQFKKGVPVSMYVTDNGLLSSINIETNEPNNKIAPLAIPESHSQKFDPSSLSGEILRSESTAKRAELASNLIYELRDNRKAYNTPDEVDNMPDGKALEILMNNMKHDEESLLTLFNGTKEEEYITTSIDLVPTKIVDGQILLRFSDHYGFVDQNDLCGEPIYASIKMITPATAPLDAKGEKKALPKNAVVYTIPAVIELTLTYEGKEIFSDKFPIAQFGIRYGLDPNLFSDKKEPFTATFNLTTGNVMNLAPCEVESDSAK